MNAGRTAEGPTAEIMANRAIRVELGKEKA